MTTNKLSLAHQVQHIKHIMTAVLMCFYSTGVCLSSSLNSNAGMTFLISFSITKHQNLVPVLFAIMIASASSLTDLGGMQCYTVLMGFHPVSWSNITNYAIMMAKDLLYPPPQKGWFRDKLVALLCILVLSKFNTVFKALRSLKGTQDEFLSVHSMSTLHPWVIILGYVSPPSPIKDLSSINKACPLLWWLTISFLRIV